MMDSEKKEYTWILQGNWKLWNMKVTIIPIIIIVLGTVIEGLVKGGLWNKRTSENNPKNSNIEISRNTEKSPGVLRRLAVAQTPA